MINELFRIFTEPLLCFDSNRNSWNCLVIIRLNIFPSVCSTSSMITGYGKWNNICDIQENIVILLEMFRQNVYPNAIYEKLVLFRFQWLALYALKLNEKYVLSYNSINKSQSLKKNIPDSQMIRCMNVHYSINVRDITFYTVFKWRIKYISFQCAIVEIKNIDSM